MKASSTRAALAIIAVIALLLGLGACGGGSSSDLVGVWEVETMDAGDSGSLSGDEIPDALKVTVTMNSDGSASLAAGGESQTGTWTSSGSTVTLTADGDSGEQSMELTLADGKLTGTVEGMTLVFAKK